MLKNTILDAIGNTPIVKLNRIGAHLPCEFYAKCEFMNPGGSLKDRIALYMVEQAEKAGRIKPGYTLIEATSGNTGIGLAMVGAVKGYRVIIAMTQKISQEKHAVLSALGAEVIRTPTELPWDHPDSYLSVAKRLAREIPNAWMMNQYDNPDNPEAHFLFTAEEIVREMGPDLKMVVIGVGTGGAISGISRRLKAWNPAIQIIGADPEGSVLGGGAVKPYLVEGIGYDFLPHVLNNQSMDRYIKVTDRDSFLMARQLIRKEGLLVGGSSGSVVWAALQAAQTLQAGEKCLVLLPDSIRNYLSKFVSDQWLIQQGLIQSSEELQQLEI